MSRWLKATETFVRLWSGSGSTRMIPLGALLSDPAGWSQRWSARLFQESQTWHHPKTDNDECGAESGYGPEVTKSNCVAPDNGRAG